MKVLVSGSVRGIDNHDLRSQIYAAAGDLGKCLAQAGHTLLVGSDDREDIDPFVVEGFQSVQKAPPVEVHLMKGAKSCCSGKTIKNLWHRYDDWDVTVLEVVRDVAQGVIVIGGKTGVIQARHCRVDVGLIHHSIWRLRRRGRKSMGVWQLRSASLLF